MTIAEIRLINMEWLAEELAEKTKAKGLRIGKYANFAEFVDTAPSYISQARSKKTSRNIGDELARKCEEKFNKPRGWMDVLHNNEVLTKSYSNTIADNNSKYSAHKIHELPLLPLDKHAVCHYISSNINKENKKVVTTNEFGKNAFAITINSNNLFANKGDFVVFDPDTNPRHDKYVLATFNDNIEILRYIIVAGEPYLEPLVPNIPAIKITENNTHKIIATAVYKGREGQYL